MKRLDIHPAGSMAVCYTDGPMFRLLVSRKTLDHERNETGLKLQPSSWRNHVAHNVDMHHYCGTAAQTQAVY